MLYVVMVLVATVQVIISDILLNASSQPGLSPNQEPSIVAYSNGTGNQFHKNTTNKGSNYIERKKIYNGHLLYFNGFWYVRNGTETDEICLQGDTRLRYNEEYWYGRGKSGKWYTFKNPPPEFLKYLSTLPMRYDRERTKFDGKDWFIMNNKGSYERIIRRGPKSVNKELYVLAEDGRWYKIREKGRNKNIAKALEHITIANLPTASSLLLDSVDDLLLTVIDGVWYMTNKTLKDRLVEQGDGRGWKKVLYVRGESGRWYRLGRPSRAFQIYAKFRLPVHFDSQRFIYSDGEYYIRTVDNHFHKIIQTGSQFDNRTLHVLTTNNKWNRITVSNETEKLVTELLNTLPKAKDLYHNYRLRRSDDKSKWTVITNNRYHKFTAYGDLIVYARTANKKWYRFINPSEDFHTFLTKLEWSYGIAPFQENIL